MQIFSPDSEVMEFLSKVTDFIILNLLTVLCSIPIITIGAAHTAKFYTSMKIVRGEEPSVTKSYFKSFKDNFPQVTVAWLIVLLVGLVLAFDWYNVLYGRAASMPILLKAVLGVLSFVVWSVAYCMFPFEARYKVTLKELFKASMVMALLNFPRMVLIFIVTFLPYIICAWYIEWGLAIWLLCTTVTLYYISREFNKQLEMLNKEEEIVESGNNEAC
ncbi:YesL family protein [Butyrivibrio fibrisolvens]|uniref:YesL family protein n=1 Tax=Pseudobutyrivibrio ruminis TaxID=46206 RepID=UPI0004226587|nr:YesL family protein [Pseudobutyrivibrio ruminis]MDC7279898.1 YesL family protein [Butyrivibrio fibrisolvens]